MKHTLLLASLFLAANASAQSTTIVHLDGEKVVIPFTLINDWIFIDGEINGTKGRWMFDTGAAKSGSMNSLKVDQDDGKVIRTGFVGSGQITDHQGHGFSSVRSEWPARRRPAPIHASFR